jgi:hypothetical protein
MESTPAISFWTARKFDHVTECLLLSETLSLCCFTKFHNLHFNDIASAGTMRPKLALWSICALLCLVAFVLSSAASEPVSVVHVVFSNHFDAGFALPAEAPSTTPPPSYAADVVNRYFQEYFPLAIKTAEALAAQTGHMFGRWKGGSWLLSLYLHCFNLPSWKRVQCSTSDQ